nr:EOG090X0EYV [Eurycercus lamellatus]
MAPQTQTTDLQKKSNPQHLKPGQLGFSKDGGEVYNGFTYYPRHPNQEDPSYKPTHAFMVQRIRSMKKKPYWEKDVLIRFGIDGKSSDIAIVANTPQNCALLWKVKHITRITPITIPQGLPENGDYSGARLQDNGELVFVPKLKSYAKTTEIQSGPKENPDFMDGQTLMKHLRLKWLQPYD